MGPAQTTASGRGARNGGPPLPGDPGAGKRPMGGRTEFRSYYGKPVIAEPVWSWEIPLYFFTGGLGGASAALAFGAGVAGNETLARRAWIGALGGLAASPPLLVSDLGKPSRFLNMLRMFKPTSPMSMGTWLLMATSGATALGAAESVLGWFGPLGRAAKPAAAALGSLVTTYTAVLVSDTSVPVWHEARRELPFVFASSSAMTAGALATLTTPEKAAGPARALALGGAAAGLTGLQVMERRLGELGEPYKQGAAGALGRAAKACTAAGAVALAVGRRRGGRATRVAGAGLMLGGAALERWSVFRAGFQSARDPKYTVGPQRARDGAY